MPAFRIGETEVLPGQRARLELPIARLPTETWLSLPIEVVNGVRDGPRLWLSGALHGDEINGVEIIREVLGELEPAQLAGTVVAVPIVNVYGFVSQSRYLPDRRDLNRAFPGSPTGSLAGRLADLFMREVVVQCTHGIDYHTGSNHRTNLPQIRANLKDDETRRCAEAFAAPVMMHAQMRDGSLRQAASRRGIHVLVYEAGEPLRFDADAIAAGVEGTKRMIAALGMQAFPGHERPPVPTTLVSKSTWIRAKRSGILRLEVQLGQQVKTLERLGIIADAFGGNAVSVVAPAAGFIIGHTNNPLVHQGEALINLALTDPPK